jgi:hypothetical protein
MTTTELDSDLLARAAEECLTRPSDSAWFDDRLFTTHGCVYTWADRTDDAVAESNYRVWLADLEGVAGEDFDTHVIASSAGHWLVGSVQHIFVQVYDEAGGYTPAFIRSVENAESIRDYPILDEMDWSEVETEHDEREARDWLVDDVIREARRIVRDEARDSDYADDLIEDADVLDFETVTAAYWEARSDGRVERWSSDDYQGLDDFARSLVARFLLVDRDDETEPEPEPWVCPGQIALPV